MGWKPGGDPASSLEPRLRTVDWPSGELQQELRWSSPLPEPGAHTELTGATRVGDRLLQCTRSEVLTIDLASSIVIDVLRHPLLFDVHSVVPSAEGLVVTCAGHESVLVFAEGRLVRHWFLRDDPFDTVFPADFARVPFTATKPHTHHPNYAFADSKGRLWATCLEQRACVCEDGRRIALPGPPHDGVLLDGLRWFTTVDGTVLAFDPASHEVVHRYALQTWAGWCRGIALSPDGTRVFVGMTALRASRHRELLGRLWRGEKRGTRVVELDRASGEVIREVDVGNEAGGTLYAIQVLAA